ncbi:MULTISPECIES: M20 family metallo-hydrolase [unclassified Halomonas]|uniref:M20 family metallo-hydrolase n=1 Tax=unclassified Halomonas TaxID=2609666 RepID=UPI0006D9B50D|nr:MULTISPECIES: M20 family metallo-hydrolase [unclassified Halomonas]KPQ21468.1 MAG: N-carbamoyl-L-amino-acid hydrolase [Halomonas sp. HL-93]SBR50185.1 N-carbamoyl-L-amino-acid hydrolase [Halomonas sp. HL-93]SNY96710.1 N-carbamoyl-L-amino-acid hydrolase [Halomonas sp. hl-4]
MVHDPASPNDQTACDLPAIAAAVNPRRLAKDLATLAMIGAREDGGVARLALDSHDISARRWLVEQASELGANASVDAMGNVFLDLPGSDPELAPVVTGSHLDSQPAGGKYDGALGVLAGLEALRALKAAGFTPRHPLSLVSWTNEEGARFSPGTSGSAVFCNVRSLEATRLIKDSEGMTMGHALDMCLAEMDAADVPRRPMATPMHAFIELHIEQGPILERKGASVGVVEGIQGVSWFEVTVEGSANHAGTTPRAHRRDALEGACAVATALREAARDSEDRVRFTIGKFDVSPGSVNTIPDRVTFSIDLRHPEGATLKALEATFNDITQQTWAGCRVTLASLSRIEPVAFPDTLTAQIDATAGELGITAPHLVSGAFHDAIHLANHCPTAMLFVPCHKGLSHHPDEHTELDDAVVGTQLLAASLARLSQ